LKKEEFVMVNRNIRTIIGTAVFAFCTVIFSSIPGNAAEYLFERIADTYSGIFSQLSQYDRPWINDNGDVFIHGTVEGMEGIYRTDGSSLTTVVDTTGQIQSFQRYSVNNFGEVAGVATLDSGVQAIYMADGIQTTIISEAGGEIRGFGAVTDINDSGQVAYHAILDATGKRMVMRYDGESITEMTIQESEIVPDLNGIAINESGHVAFEAALAHRTTGICLADGTNVSVLTSMNLDTDGYLIKPDVSMNANGKIAFYATSASGSVVFALENQDPKAFVDTQGSFKSFVFPLINDADQIIFEGTLDDGPWGIFSGPDPLQDKVIKKGDVIGGTTLDNVRIGRGALNNHGQIVFWAYCRAGEEVYVATPKPYVNAMPWIHLLF
jgi:hypothetical protein